MARRKNPDGSTTWEKSKTFEIIKVKSPDKNKADVESKAQEQQQKISNTPKPKGIKKEWGFQIGNKATDENKKKPQTKETPLEKAQKQQVFFEERKTRFQNFRDQSASKMFPDDTSTPKKEPKVDLVKCIPAISGKIKLDLSALGMPKLPKIQFTKGKRLSLSIKPKVDLSLPKIGKIGLSLKGLRELKLGNINLKMKLNGLGQMKLNIPIPDIGFDFGFTMKLPNLKGLLGKFKCT